MNKFSRTARSVTFAAIVGLSLGVSAPGAFAVAEEVQAVQAASGNIDFKRTGSITIHKYIGTEKADIKRDGSDVSDEVDRTDAKKIDDGRVQFKVTQVEANLKTNEGFAAASKLTADTAKPMSGGKSGTITLSGGVGSLSGLPIGVYKVEEEVLEKDTPGKPKLQPAPAFLVFVPTTAADGNSWNYDVHAFPKNSESVSLKEVTDKNKNDDDSVTYAITADAPVLKEKETVEEFEFTDELEFDRISYVENSAKVFVDGVPLAQQDFTVKPLEEMDGTGIHQGERVQKLTVVIEESGRAKITSGAKVKLTFDAKVKPLTGADRGDNVINNDATVTFRNPGAKSKTDLKTNEVETYHGKLKLIKSDNNSDELLSGAKFKLYRCNSAEDLGQEVSIKGESEWTTDSKGEITWNALHVSDFADGKDLGAAEFKYCLKETVPPAGYKLNETPKVIEFTRQSIKSTEDGSDSITAVAKVVNLREDTPKLPMTGGAGVGILAAIGAAIIGAGAWFARRNSAES
ncbi:isopeptide-forming domain-containing fimbrial protein [Corynebacterium diphtheriae]|nr:isopeptide-forming domain-containing fimbrial protein [Corynebacterium diphtheriae]CAB0925093.1 isopeptide-forming domain-containing fimbrial protein [Corynebacterium diphtheriae]CAB0925328.1 isopeptide-forming domain-containing fimbrial protein [Corynebacterium diphtheriae]